MSNVPEIFGSMVFSEAVMQARLPHETYKQVIHAIHHDRRLTPEIATVVATAMKNWAVEKGATHFTHWFQPMTGMLKISRIEFRTVMIPMYRSPP